jgi:hypothetical protein
MRVSSLQSLSITFLHKPFTFYYDTLLGAEMAPLECFFDITQDSLLDTLKQLRPIGKGEQVLEKRLDQKELT